MPKDRKKASTISPPLADLITPNHFEFEWLCGAKATTIDQVIAQAQALMVRGPSTIVVTSAELADTPDGDFQPVAGNPIMRGQRACLFQNIFNHRFYGYDCHLETADKWVLEEVEAPLVAK